MEPGETASDPGALMSPTMPAISAALARAIPAGELVEDLWAGTVALLA
jgi:hypothetical protein